MLLSRRNVYIFLLQNIYLLYSAFKKSITKIKKKKKLFKDKQKKIRKNKVNKKT